MATSCVVIFEDINSNAYAYRADGGDPKTVFAEIEAIKDAAGMTTTKFKSATTIGAALPTLSKNYAAVTLKDIDWKVVDYVYYVMLCHSADQNREWVVAAWNIDRETGSRKKVEERTIVHTK